MIANSLCGALEWIDAGFCHQLTQALVHFLWQGCAIALVYAVALRGLRQASANARYVAGVIALVLMAACLPATFWLLPPHASELATSHGAVEVSSSPAAIAATAPGDAASESPVGRITIDTDATAILPPAGMMGAVTIRHAPAKMLATDYVATFLAWASPYASGLYLCGVVVMLSRVWLGLWGGRKLRQACVPLNDGAICAIVRDHARRMAMRIVPAIAFCERISVPVVLGVWRPMILVPATLVSGLTPQQLQAVLLHELAHIHRFDLAINLLQRLVEAVLFFHPAVWWLSRKISLERENACDDIVLRFNCGRTEYADALLRVAELCAAVGDRSMLGNAVLAASGGNTSQFKRRVLRLLHPNDKPTMRLTTNDVVVSLLLVFSLILAPAVWRDAVHAGDTSGGRETSESADIGKNENSAPAGSLASDNRVNAALEILRAYDLHHGGSVGYREWASSIRELIQIGTPALPQLIQELDRTNREETLRALGFVLRGIGDPRAVPALIRAIPRALQATRGDYSLHIDDPELLHFMQQHDISSIIWRHNHFGGSERQPDEHEPNVFDYGSTYNEIMPALEKLTGQSHDWTELCHVHDTGGVYELHIKRTLYVTYAGRWADWWSKNWQRYVKDKADGQLDLNRQSLEQYGQSIPIAPNQQSRSEFPCGPNVTGYEAIDSFIGAFDEPSTRSLVDLNTGRCPIPPQELVKRCQGHEPSQELLTWANQEGVNLISVKFTPPGSDKSYYAFKPLGMKVWRIANGRYDNVLTDLQQSKTLELPALWEGPLVQIDETTGLYDDKLTVSFSFITSRGTCGAIQMQSPVSREPASGPPKSGGVRYRFIYEGDVEKRATQAAAHSATVDAAWRGPSTILHATSAQEVSGDLPPVGAAKPGDGTPVGGTSQPPADAKTFQAISISAEAFSKLPPSEQRALLVRAFERRLEHAKNIYFEIDQVISFHENRNGAPGDLIKDSPPSHLRYRHWRVGDSFREDSDLFENLESTKVTRHSSCGNNAEEGVARNVQIWPGSGPPQGQVRYPISPLDSHRYVRWQISTDGKKPPQGQVQYPISPLDNDPYVRWLSHSPDPSPWTPKVEYLMPYLLEHQDEFEITAPVEGNMVQVTCPWQPSWARQPNGKRIYLLDPAKGFLPVRSESRYDDPHTVVHIPWRAETFTVEESRLVGDVWMPTEITEQLGASTMSNLIDVCKLKVSRIECGTVKLADLFIPFPEGTRVAADVIEGATYVVDAQGNARDVKFERGWWQKPPAGWSHREPGAGSPSWTSRILPADREKLAAEKEKIADREGRMAVAVKRFETDATASQADRIEGALEVLRTYRTADKQQLWASAIRELITIGKPAVPTLIEELDRTEREETLRALGFVLRGINDPRTIPAIIRAIPRLLQPPRSDYGMLLEDDPELAQFMQDHDQKHDGKPRPSGSPGVVRSQGIQFGYGRPIREMMSALKKMTGESNGWQEVNFVHLDGGPEQRRIQRKQYLALMERWADWWSKHWQEHVANEADAQLEQIKKSLDQSAKSIAATKTDRPPQSEFPSGPNVVEGDASHNQSIKSFDESPSRGFGDLDSGRYPRPPKELLADSPNGKPSAALLAWAEREEVDLINIKVTPPGSERSLYAFLPVGMRVWRIANGRYDNLLTELQQSKKLELPASWEGPLVQIDETTGAYDDKLTVSFLFITREGTCGAIQLQSPVSQELVTGTAAYSAGGVHIRTFYEGSPEKITTVVPAGK